MTEVHEVEKLLAGQDWSAITMKLVAFAHRRLGRRSLETAKEVAQEALTRIWDPKYKDWDPHVEPSLLKHLGSVVNGIVRNMHTAPGVRAEVLQDPVVLVQTAEPGASDGRGVDGKLDAGKFLDRLLEKAVDDELVTEVIFLMSDSVDRPKEQAEKLNRPVREIYNANRRLVDYRSAVSKAFEKEQVDGA